MKISKFKLYQLRLGILSFIFLSISTNVFAQTTHECGIEYRNQYMLKNGLITPNYLEAEPTNTQRWKQGIIIIPVVVHVLYNNPEQNISDEQIFSQIDVLNEDFRMQNSDVSNVRSEFSSLPGDAQFEFCLASVDPSGNPTTGITRTSTAATYFVSFNDQMMSSSTNGIDPWNTADYLNIWVCKLDGRTGYSIFPWFKTSMADGVVVDYANFGRIQDAYLSTFFNLGRITTHEVGHYLGLYHNFQDGCVGGNGSTCSAQGDKVCDTPPQISWVNTCDDATLSSCQYMTQDTLAQYENFMDYTKDDCRVMFTQGQIDRMKTQFSIYRSSLLSSAACPGVSSVEEKEHFHANIFPNPAKDQITIETNANKELDIEIYNITGVKMSVISNRDNQSTIIDVSDYAQGIYFVKFISNKEVIKSKKITITH